jgi:V8-like Glu-specific endopeptidase
VSGERSNRVRCGKVNGIKRVYSKDEEKWYEVLKVANLDTVGGDSGAPVWSPRTGASIGMLLGHVAHGSTRIVTPLRDKPTGRHTTIHGALDAPEMNDMHILTTP